MKKRRPVKRRQSPEPASAGGSGGEASAADPRGGDEGKQQQRSEGGDRSPSPGEGIAARAKRHRKKETRRLSDPSPVRQGIPSGVPDHALDHALVGEETVQQEEEEEQQQQQHQAVGLPPHSLTSNRDGDAQAPGEASAALSNERDLLRKGCLDKATLLRDQSGLHASHSSTLLGGTDEEASFDAEESSTCLKAEQRLKSCSCGEFGKIAQDEDEKVSDKIDAHAIEYHKQEQGEAEWKALILMEDETITEEINNYYRCKLENREHCDYSEYEPQQQTEVYERLALYRIRAYEAQSATLEYSNLKKCYPPSYLESNRYFKHYEKSLEWYFDPERCKRKCFDDYQRLVLRHHLFFYLDWDRYQSTLNTYEQDLEYVHYCQAVENAIKWIKDHLAPSGTLAWSRVENVARLQALKIAEDFPSVSRDSSESAFLELLSLFRFHHMYRDGVDGLYFEIWKRVAVQKMDFKAALSEIQKENLFPLRKIDIEYVLQNKRGRLCLEDDYDTYVACIDETVSPDKAHQRIGDAVKEMVPIQHTYEDYVMKKVEVAKDIGVIREATCALAACTMAVEAMHRFLYEMSYGKGTFPWAAAEPHELLRTCQSKGIWTKGEGASVSDVLNKIQELGGVRTTNVNAAPSHLPLSSWRKHAGDELSPRLVAKLLDCGPCVGRLWVCPWYHVFDATRDDIMVYRGCGRSEENRRKSKRLYGDEAGLQAVVCFTYRTLDGQMHVQVLDNHEATGPRRWIDVNELDALYTLTVDCLDPQLEYVEDGVGEKRLKEKSAPVGMTRLHGPAQSLNFEILSGVKGAGSEIGGSSKLPTPRC